MSDPQDPKPDEGWKDIDDGTAPHAAPGDEAPAPMEFTPEERVLGVRRPTPPGVIGSRVGVLAFLIMAALYVFTDVRTVDTPWQRSMPLVYVLALIPAFGLLWGLIGLVKRVPDDLPRVAAGIVLSLAAFGLGYFTLTNSPPPGAEGPAISGDRIEMAPKDLTQWREKKLHRTNQ
jgi:hypothetical protein